MQDTLTHRRKLAVVGLVSLSLVASELVWTRIFSAELFYTFAFLTLSIAVLGLGLGALALRLSSRLQLPKTIAVMLVVSAVFAAAGPVIVIALDLDFSQLLFSPAMLGKFLLAVSLLGLPYFCIGVVLASLFKANHQQMDQLYMGDLLGAAAGVALALVVMNSLGTPAAVFLIPVPTLIACILIQTGALRSLAVALCLASVALLPQADRLLEGEREERAPVIYKHWDAMAKIKVFDYGPGARGMNIDNIANTPVINFDGNLSELREANETWDIDVGNLVRRFDSATFLSLGAGGGADVLQALQHDAAEIHAVEVNPHINKMMLEGDPSGYLSIFDEDGERREFTPTNIFSGGIYSNPAVKVVSEDARTYVRRFNARFDVIYSLSSNTFAALGSGSFAFAENYLFTVEAFIDYWNALSAEGFLVMEHQFYMPRLVSDVMVALPQLGIEHPEQHIAVYRAPNLRRDILLLSKKPLTDDVRQTALGQLNGEDRAMKHLAYPLPVGADENLINRIVTQGWRNVRETADIDVSPNYDDRPFVAQMGLWKNFELEKLKSSHPIGDVFGFPLSKAILTLIVGVILFVVIPLNLLPYFLSRHSQGNKLSLSSWSYFFCIGLAFMVVEIILIQKYTLVIGASIYSIATVLLILLLASGIGSRFSRRFGDVIPFAAISIGIMLLLAADSYLIGVTYNLPAPLRALAVSAMVFPLGFFMGMPFVKGALRVGELIDWGFAVNGAASVLGATLAIIMAFNFGYAVALLVAIGLYAISGVLLLRKLP